MNVKIHSTELNRMMKTITQCIDPKSPKLGNIEVIYDNNLFTIRSTNGHMSAVVSTPLLGGNGEVFCVDGTMFARVCAMCNGEVGIETNGRVCSIKGAGRTRLPIVDADIPAFDTVTGKECKIRAELFTAGYNSVSYAISADQNRPVLTGVYMESTGDAVNMVTLDGFKMAVESVPCEADGFTVVVPGFFMKLVSASVFAGETVKFRTDGKRIQASTDGMMIACTLLANDFPDYKKIVPQEFRTSTILHADAIQYALKSGSVVNTANNLVKLVIGDTNITVMSNSEQADFDADISCMTNGEGLKIAFNHKYLMETIASITGNEIVMRFNSSVSPCIISEKTTAGYRLILPVRVAG